MEILSKKVLLASLLTGVGYTAQAASFSSVLSPFLDPDDGRVVVFEDTTYSFVTPSFLDGITDADIGQEVFAAFNIQRIGLSSVTTTLDGPGNDITSPSPVPTVQSTQTAGVTVEGTIQGTILDVNEVDGTITVGRVTASVYTADFFEDSPVTTRDATEAAFSDLTLAATFETVDSDDFFTVTFDDFGTGTDFITGFSLGLSVTNNATLPGIIETPISFVNGGGDADLFASGSVTVPSAPAGTPSGTFVTGDADFSINLIPSPAAAGFGLIGMVGLVARRRRS